MEGATEREDGQPAVREGGGVVAGGFEPERVVRGGCLRAKSGSPGARVRRSRAPRSRERTHRLREFGIDVVPHRDERCARGARRRLRPDEAREGHRAGGRRWLSVRGSSLEVTAISTGKLQTN